MDKFVIKKVRVYGNTNPSLTLETPAPVPGTSASSSVDCSSNLKSIGKGRSFQKSWLTKYSWLDYKEETDKAFCKVCKEAEAKGLIKFTLKKEDAFTSAGFSNWKRALEKFRIHEATHVHKEGIFKLSTIANSSIAVQLNEQMNDGMKKARLALTAIFTTVKFLCRQGLAIRGHEDINSNFQQLLELRKEDVPELKGWLNRSGPGYKWTSHDIQNEIIDLLGQSVLRLVLANIKKCEYFSIMVDETSDVSIHEQLSFCIRTVNDDLSINEDFIGLYETPNTESQTLFSIVQDILLRLDLSMKNLRGQCYDGASNMCGKFKGLQKLVSNVQDKAIYVHCTAHSLNLAVGDSLRYLTSMRDIMNLAKDLINNVRESPKRMEIFRNVSSFATQSDKAGLRPLCPTRWTRRASSVQQILKNYEHLLELFETINSSDRNEAGYKCKGFLESMLKFNTYFLLQLYCHVMNPVEEVNRKVQSPDLSVTDLEDIFINLACILEEQRGRFEDFWKFCLEVKPPSVGEPELARKRRAPRRYENEEAGAQHTFNTPAEFFKRMYIEVCETVQSCVTSRFESTGVRKVIPVERECLSVLKKGEKSDMICSKEFFKNDLDTDRLFLHLSMLYDITKQKNLRLDTMDDVKNIFLQEPSVKGMLPELVKCVKLLQVVPVTSATNERSFSALRRLKTYLRATMGQKRLNNVAIAHAHCDILDEMDIRPVINNFIQKNPLRRSCFALY